MQSSVTPAVGNFEQPILAIIDPQAFGEVKAAIESAFSAGKVEKFMKSLTGSSIRIRDFETVLGRGLLGNGTKAKYESLENADQGQIREFYLASLEHVAPEVREKFFKLYAYY